MMFGNIQKPELLAPGGSVESMRAAVRAGADAIYMGGSRFSARAYARNPEQDDLVDAIEYCHIHGKKLYLTVNTLLKEDELKKDLYGFLKPAYEAGLDAVLIQDMGVFSFIRREFPGLPLHASTQMSVQSVSGARLLQEMGAERIVPARELSLKEIREIYDATGMEIETFVHGALCYSYSGQCLMSSLIGGRSGNRGRCAQPCRKEYSLYDASGRKKQQNKGKYLISLKDICTLHMIPDLLGAGVCSFKIEGRMKRAEYAAGVVSAYRRQIDRILSGDMSEPSEEEVKDLMDLYNRGGFSEGYYKRQNGISMMTMERPNHAGTQAAQVLKDGRLKALQNLSAGDLLEIARKKDGSGEEIALKQDYKKGTLFSLKTGKTRLNAGTILPRVKNERLLNSIQKQYLESELQEKIKGKFILKAEQPAILYVSAGHAEVSVYGDSPAKAQNRAVTSKDLEKQLKKTGGTPFVFEKLTIEMDDDLFYPVSALNNIRRDALDQLKSLILSESKRALLPDREFSSAMKEKSNAAHAAAKLNVQIETYSQLKMVSELTYVSRVYMDSSLWTDSFSDKEKDNLFSMIKTVKQNGKECFLVLPWLWRKRVQKRFYECFDAKSLELFDGFLLRCTDQIRDFRHRSDQEIVTDSNLYSFNSEAKAFWREMGATGITCPAELNKRELASQMEQDSEMIVYGYQPVMLTAQCLMKNTTGCTGKPDLLFLEDGKNARFPVRTHCGICMNVIYNSLPLNLLDAVIGSGDICPGQIRIAFTIENENQMRQICERTWSLMSGSQTADTGSDVSSSFTRGHFKRGVE